MYEDNEEEYSKVSTTFFQSNMYINYLLGVGHLVIVEFQEFVREEKKRKIAEIKRKIAEMILSWPAGKNFFIRLVCANY